MPQQVTLCSSILISSTIARAVAVEAGKSMRAEVVTDNDGVTLTEQGTTSPRHLMFYAAKRQEAAATDYSDAEFTDARLAKIARSLYYYYVQYNDFDVARSFIVALFSRPEFQTVQLWMDNDNGVVLDAAAVRERLTTVIDWDWRSDSATAVPAIDSR